MIHITKEIPWDCRIFFSGDWHVGSIASSSHGISQFVDDVNSSYNGKSARHNYVIHMGDLLEGITIDDPRYDPTTCLESSILQQMQDVVRNAWSYKKRIIVSLQGNHERKLLTKVGDVSKKICEDLDIPYGTYTCVINFIHGKTKTPFFKIYCWHGNGTINSKVPSEKRQKLNMELALENKLKNKSGDCAVMAMAHTHKLIVSKPVTDPGITTLYLTNKDKMVQKFFQEKEETDYIEPRHRWFINTGGFFKTFVEGVTTYAEAAGYDPIPIGYPVLEVEGGKPVGVKEVFV